LAGSRIRSQRTLLLLRALRAIGAFGYRSVTWGAASCSQNAPAFSARHAKGNQRDRKSVMREIQIQIAMEIQVIGLLGKRPAIVFRNL
jgi:hypothetical protein